MNNWELFGVAIGSLIALNVGLVGGGLFFVWWRAHGREEHLVHVFRREMQRAERKKVLL